MGRTKAVILASVVALVVAACGGSSGNGGTTPPPSGGGTGSANPCSTAAAEEAELGPVGLVAGGQATAVTNKKSLVDGNPRGRAVEGLWLHDAAEKQRQEPSRGLRLQAGAPQESALTSPAPVGEDVGDIAVLQDQGDLIAPANQLDIGSTGLRFTRNGSNGYTVSKIDIRIHVRSPNTITAAEDIQASKGMARTADSPPGQSGTPSPARSSRRPRSHEQKYVPRN